MKTTIWLALTIPWVLCAQIAPVTSRDQEISMALSAAPPTIAAHAAVYVLTPTGYEKARGGSNGFTCLVVRPHIRTHPDEMGPVCYDPEGTRAVAPRIIAEARLQLEGKSEDEINRVVQQGLKDGTFLVPRRAGIAYMLSPDANGIFPGTDTVSRIEPHVMIYAPYLKNTDIGGVMPKPGEHQRLPFVLQEGAFNALIIVPLPRD
jgi:hypothetical protein